MAIAMATPHSVPPSNSLYGVFFISCCLDVWGQKVSLAFFAHHCQPIATFTPFPTLSQILSLEHFSVFYFAYPAGSYCSILLLHILKSLHKIGTQHEHDSHWHTSALSHFPFFPLCTELHCYYSGPHAPAATTPPKPLLLQPTYLPVLHVDIVTHVLLLSTFHQRNADILDS